MPYLNNNEEQLPIKKEKKKIPVIPIAAAGGAVILVVSGLVIGSVVRKNLESQKNSTEAPLTTAASDLSSESEASSEASSETVGKTTGVFAEDRDNYFANLIDTLDSMQGFEVSGTISGYNINGDPSIPTEVYRVFSDCTNVAFSGVYLPTEAEITFTDADTGEYLTSVIVLSEGKEGMESGTYWDYSGAVLKYGFENPERALEDFLNATDNAIYVKFEDVPHSYGLEMLQYTYADIAHDYSMDENTEYSKGDDGSYSFRNQSGIKFFRIQDDPHIKLFLEKRPVLSTISVTGEAPNRQVDIGVQTEASLEESECGVFKVKINEVSETTEVSSVNSISLDLYKDLIANLELKYALEKQEESKE